MDLLFPFFLIWLFQKRGEGPGPAVPWVQPTAPKPKRKPPTTQPWPQVIPVGLPSFPGSAWEYDHPPPRAVVSRAKALLPVLWKRGRHTHKTENTAGRWIVYRAERTKGGKKGVVAYRQKSERSSSRAPKAQTASRRAPRPRPAPVPAPRGPVLPRASASPAVPTLIRTAPPKTLKLPVLRYGMGLKPHPPSAAVKDLQKRLKISADGRFGKGTRTAVKAFQRSHGLTVDGVVGKQTWGALYAGRA